MYPPTSPDPNQPYGTPPSGDQPAYGTPSQPYGTPPAYGTPSQPYGAPPAYGIPSQPYPGAPGYAAAPGYAVPVGVPTLKTNGLAVTSMVLGIIGVVFVLCPLGGEILAPLLGLLAVIFGAVGLNQARSGTFSKGSRGMAIAGLVTGVIAMLFDVIFVLVILGALSGAAAGVSH